MFNFEAGDAESQDCSRWHQNVFTGGVFLLEWNRNRTGNSQYRGHLDALQIEYNVT